MRLLTKRNAENRSAPLPVILCACGLGLFIFFSRLGDPLALFSFDEAFHFAPPVNLTNVLIVTMSESTYDDKELNPTNRYPDFNRGTHAKFLDKLHAGGASLVVFDILFKEPRPGDDVFAAAITNHGNVVLAADLQTMDPRVLGSTTNDPAEIFLGLPGCKVGFAPHPEDLNGGRTLPIERDYHPSLPVAAATAYGTRVDTTGQTNHWIRYYGRSELLPHGLPRMDYENAYRQALRTPAFFQGKVIFIGGKPNTLYVGEQADQFATPFTRWSGQKMRGVEVNATMFLNLIRNDWLTQGSDLAHACLILLVGALFGWLFTIFKPLPGLALLLVGAIVVTVATITLVWTQRVWLNWALIAWVEIPIAWATSAIIYSRTVEREKDTLKKKLDSITLASISPAAAAAAGISPAKVVSNIQPMPTTDIVIPNYEMLKLIGDGAYGQVWLARNTTVKIYRAIKVVFRNRFAELRPFEREFEGVSNFVNLSENHAGWVTVHDVGKDETRGYFYYAMEIADDALRGQQIEPDSYSPRTLSNLLVEHEHLPVPQCIDLGIGLAAALAALHGEKLVHRDVKPSNIIFARNRPKLADIGLVASAENPKSINGTEGYMPDKQFGTPLADIFSLGRVLYVAATGSPPTRHPGLPTTLGVRDDAADLMRLMDIINKACASCSDDPERYQTATEMYEELLKLRASLGKTQP